MYIDKQALYESFLSRGFDDACARLMAGLDPATVLEANTIDEIENENTAKKLKEIETKYHQKSKPIDDAMNNAKKRLALMYEKLDEVINDYRNGKKYEPNTMNQDEKRRLAETEKNVQRAANGEFDNQPISDSVNIFKAIIEAGGNADNTQNTGTNAEQNKANAQQQNGTGGKESAGNNQQQVQKKSEQTQQNASSGNSGSNNAEKKGTVNLNEIAKHWNEYGKEKRAEIRKSLSEQDDLMLDSILSEIDNANRASKKPAQKEEIPNEMSDYDYAKVAIKIDHMEKSERDAFLKDLSQEQRDKLIEIRKKIDSGEIDVSRDASEQQEPNGDAGNGQKNSDDTSGKNDDAKNADGEPKYDESTGNEEHGSENDSGDSEKRDGAENTDKNKEQNESGSTGKESSGSDKKVAKKTETKKEVFPPISYTMKDGKPLKNLIIGIRRETLDILQLAIRKARVTNEGLWAIRKYELKKKRPKVPANAIKEEASNYSKLSPRVMYQNIFGNNGRGIRLDVFRIDEFKNIE